MADLYRDLPKTWGSPTMSPHCADEIKYEVADRVVARMRALQAKARRWAAIRYARSSPSTACASPPTTEPGAGPRVVKQAGIGGRGGKPGLRGAHARKFAAVDSVLRENPEVGAYNQTI